MATTTTRGRKRAKTGAKPPRKKKQPLTATDNEAGEESNASKREMVVRLLGQIEEKLKREAVKASVADFIRLLQLERELSEDDAREVVVRWVEPTTEPDSDA